MVVNEVVTRHSIWTCHAVLPLTFGVANMSDAFMQLWVSIWLH